MAIIVVIGQALRAIEVIIAVLAIRMARALHIVLFQAKGREEIEVAVVAHVVIGRVSFMLDQRLSMREVALTSVAVFHTERQL